MIIDKTFGIMSTRQPSQQLLGNVPSITVDGNSYLSDRFYLLRPHGDTKTPQDSSCTCTCGAQSPPHLLDKSRLVASLDLRAAILGTYTVDLAFVRQELPTLFGGIPTLLLHGHKGLQQQMKRMATKRANNSSQQRQSKYSDLQQKRAKTMQRQENTFTEDTSDDEESQHNKELDKVTCNPTVIKEEDDVPPEEGWINGNKQRTDNDSLPFSLPENFHLTHVLPTWLPPDSPVHSSWSTKKQTTAKRPDHLIIIDSDDEQDHKGVHPEIVKARRHQQGVHHPKFMILFERSGSVIVMVTTSNLTNQTSVDGAWVQRFYQTPTTTKPVTNPRADGSDFGYVLSNFLQHESNAASECHLLPEEFLYKYCDIDGFDNFRRSYRFEESQVHLIAHVPGNHSGRHTSTHLGKNGDGQKRTFLFGPQRVADIVERLQNSGKHGKAWIPEKLHSHEDRFIVQTTSFGGYWTRENMTHLVQSYFGCEQLGNALEGGYDEALLNQMDIIWPTMKFMKSGGQIIPEIGTAHNALVSKVVPIHDDVVSTGFVFLSSLAFNTIDLPCISRMKTYDESTPTQRISLKTPHFKSYIRLLESNRESLQKEYGEASENFSWLLLTSACLSRGAQGKPTQMRSIGSDEMTYSNFELGVLFCSRLRDDQKSDRLYCFGPKECSCGKYASVKSLNRIHLPIPYALRPKSYQMDRDEADLSFTPYFHEIQQGTGCIGQMKLTPLGASLAAGTKRIKLKTNRDGKWTNR